MLLRIMTNALLAICIDINSRLTDSNLGQSVTRVSLARHQS